MSNPYVLAGEHRDLKSKVEVNALTEEAHYTALEKELERLRLEQEHERQENNLKLLQIVGVFSVSRVVLLLLFLFKT